MQIVFRGNNAYVIAKGVSGYQKCNVASDGELSACQNVDITTYIPDFREPIGMAFSGNYAYLISIPGNNYVQCDVGAGDVIDPSTCTKITLSPGVLAKPFAGITFR
jgi:D-arabinose 1-dehydrogenase-like Zn-dependent alcohol dehydrogenase